MPCVCVCWEGERGVLGLLYPRSIYYFHIFLLSHFFTDDGLILLDRNSERAAKSKQQPLQPFRGNKSKITKSGRILEYF